MCQHRKCIPLQNKSPLCCPRTGILISDICLIIPSPDMEVERVLCQKSEGGKKKKIIKVKQKKPENSGSKSRRLSSPESDRRRTAWGMFHIILFSSANGKIEARTNVLFPELSNTNVKVSHRFPNKSFHLALAPWRGPLMGGA